MKKMILLLAIMLMASPALAAVNITVTDAGDNSGWATIAYAEGETDFVRAFALDITATDANIVEIDSVSADYWVFPGTIDINDEGLVEDQGSPVAPSSYPGTLGGLDTNGITIEMGALFEAGVEPEPGATGTLLRIRVDKTSEVCVAENSIRGGVVMKDPSADPTVNVECQTVTVGPGGCVCKGDVSGPMGVPDGLVSTSDMGVLLGIIGPVGAPYIAAIPPGMECLDLSGPMGVPDGLLSTSDMGVILGHIGPIGPPYIGPCIP